MQITILVVNQSAFCCDMLVICCCCRYGLVLLAIQLLSHCIFGNGFLIPRRHILSTIPTCTETTTQQPWFSSNVVTSTTTTVRRVPSITVRCTKQLLPRRQNLHPLFFVSYYSKKSFLTLWEKQSMDDIDANSRGIVSILTDVINVSFDSWLSLFQRNSISRDETETSLSDDVTQRYNSSIIITPSLLPPSSSLELLQRIRDDYTKRNYLWTGDLDVEINFIPSCRFTDPTLSFIGTDTYRKNIQNLRFIVNQLTNIETECRSDLLDIQLYDNYIETRWNMVGTFSKLPWQPRIDVIGRTKFWYHNDDNNNNNTKDNTDCNYQIYFYDEMWEIPANQALLQLITPAGMIPNTLIKK
jgi:hypothetical protein